MPEEIEATELDPVEADENTDENGDAFEDRESVFTFRPSTRYALYFIVTTTVVLLFMVSLFARFDWGSLFFLGVGLVGMGWSGDQLLSRIDLDVTELRFRQLWRQPKQVAFRQMDSLHIAGRLFSVPVIAYHPLETDGLLDLQDLLTLTLPAVEEQELLIHLLKARAIHLKMDE